MDKAVILGVYDFMNLYICKYLLDHGVEIKGVLLESEEKIPFLAEKRMEFGRNANFTELSFQDWAGEISEETVIISLYDFIMDYKEQLLEENELLGSILDYLKRREREDGLVLLIPNHVSAAGINAQRSDMLSGFLDNLMECCPNCQIIYLPAVYGPWQPESFLFQQSFLKELGVKTEMRPSREDLSDALFVEDAARALVAIIETNGPGRFLLESGTENQWDLCAAFLDLSINKKSQNEKPIFSDTVKIAIQQDADFSKALLKQKEHTRRLYCPF